MPFTIIRGDITAMKVDAIVNAAAPALLGGGGVDGAIHAAAGPGLLEECRTLGGCETGQAKLTGAYELPCRYVIHTVGPVWKGGRHGESELLASCYSSSLRLAEAEGCSTLAFPLISAGAYGFPREQAMRIAVDTITGFLQNSDMTVYLVIYGHTRIMSDRPFLAGVSRYIGETFDRAKKSLFTMPASKPGRTAALGRKNVALRQEEPLAEAMNSVAADMSAPISDLTDIMEQLDESFQQMLLRKIDESGMTDAQCYKKANIDRKLFSKIRGDVHYRPSKPTAAAFAVALELSISEAEDLLKKAGFALSDSSKFDIIIRYFIQHHNYNIFEINEALFYFDQSLLGA